MSYYYTDRIESQRIVTRWLTEEDAVRWTDFLSDPECTQYFPNAYFSSPRERAEFWVAKQLGRYENEKYGLQALIEKDSGDLIGQCGLLQQEVDGVNELEVGYHLFRKYWGRGLTPEIALAFINFAKENRLSDSVISIIHRDNIPSQRVAVKNGMAEEKMTDWNDLPVKVFRLTF